MNAPGLPSGVVTLLLTDVEGSTQLWERHPDVMFKTMQRHHEIVHGLVDSHGGALPKDQGEGDAVFAAFANATDALACAVELQLALHREAWPETTPIAVRVGLHTGEVAVRESNYFGSNVNRCARIRSLGHGGQTVVSAATAELVAERLPEGVWLRDLGTHRLKDLSRAEQVFQVCKPELPLDFPPLKSLDAQPHNLPANLTELVGRERDVAEVSALLRGAGTRLVTLVGPGGIGKTRLALQVGAELVDEFPDGVWNVSLAAAGGGEHQLTGAIAATLHVRENPGQSPLRTLGDYLASKHMLLILDNADRVVEAAPSLAELLGSAPDVKVLVTSRQAFRVRGEREVIVEPLTVPEVHGAATASMLADNPAVTLFCQRASDVRGGFALDDDNASDIAAICRRLDGLPLAIELAAARVKLFQPQALLARLDDALKVLTGGSRDMPERHQTLRAAIEWSYELLDESGRVLFRRLAVFRGATVDACEHVCAEGLGVDVIDVALELVNHSLARHTETHEGEPRFTMLETIRSFGLEQLAASGETDDIRARHAAFFTDLAAAAELDGPDRDAWLERLDDEHDNLGDAIAWQLDHDPAGALSTATAIAPYRQVRGAFTDGRRQLERALTLAADEHPSRAAALAAVSAIALDQGDLAAASSVSSDALACARSSGRADSAARALTVLGAAAHASGDAEHAAAYLDEALTAARESQTPALVIEPSRARAIVALERHETAAALAMLTDAADLARRLGTSSALAGVLKAMVLAHLQSGSTAQAHECAREALDIARGLRQPHLEAGLLNDLGRVARSEGKPEEARRHYEDSLTIARRLGARRDVAVTLHNLANVSSELGDTAKARAGLEEALSIMRDLGVRSAVSTILSGLASVALAEGDLDEARARIEESVAVAAEIGDRVAEAEALATLGVVLSKQGADDAARATFLRSAEIARELGHEALSDWLDERLHSPDARP